MTGPTSLTIRNVEVRGVPGLDVRIDGGRIAEIGARLRRDSHELDGWGGALIPGLADHHIHLFGLAAQAASVALDGARGPAEMATLIAAALDGRAPGAWVRAVGYHESIAGTLDRHDLDVLAPRHRLRIQHQTGALWVLNSLALESLGADDGARALERDADGRPTGRIWRGDAWLRERIGSEAPPLAAIGHRLAACGVTAVTDASVTTDSAAADRLADGVRHGALPFHLTLMSGGQLIAPQDGAFAVGPLKILLDDHDLIDLEDFIGRIGLARDWGRRVAVHCVTAGELALSLAAFEAAGAMAGDRIEHGGLIPSAAIAQIRALGLTVVTQPAFVRERGDRYIAEVPVEEQADLYRCASLLADGVSVAASSDAPYASLDPWLGIAAAIDRRTAGGRPLGAAERLAPEAALALYLGASGSPGGPPRQVGVGAPADLCLLDGPLGEVLRDPRRDRVRATLLAGALTFQAR
jgi:predicted amidohydrolase YtcJ